MKNPTEFEVYGTTKHNAVPFLIGTIKCHPNDADGTARIFALLKGFKLHAIKGVGVQSEVDLTGLTQP